MLLIGDPMPDIAQVTLSRNGTVMDPLISQSYVMLIQDKALNHDIIRIKLKGPLREAALKQIEKVQFENKAGFNKLVNKHGKPATKHGVDDIS